MKNKKHWHTELIISPAPVLPSLFNVLSMSFNKCMDPRVDTANGYVNTNSSQSNKPTISHVHQSFLHHKKDLPKNKKPSGQILAQTVGLSSFSGTCGELH